VRVLLTRPDADNARIARRLRPLGIACLGWPLTRIAPLVARLVVPEETEAILFTSANAVAAFAAASPERALPVLCVGERTAARAREAGFARVTSARGDARELAQLAAASGYRNFLHPHGREAGDLAAALPEARVERLAIYAAEPAGPPPAEVADAFATGALDIVTVWSPRNATILADWLARTKPRLGATALVGISEAAVTGLRGAGFAAVLVATRPHGDAMIERIGMAARQ
jgi:uroporphyrinogen-III synthase